MNRKLSALLCLAALFALNLWILSRLFHTEYTPFMGSIEGAYIGISRWLQMNWTHPGWFPLWYGGIPAENTYPPLLHFLVAVASGVTGMTVVHAHHAVTALFYCLGPLALFWLVLRLTESQWKAFIAGWIYTILSPCAFLLHNVRVDLQSVWGARKLQALIFYGEGPHVTAITLLIVALAAVHAALEHEPDWRMALAVVASAAVAMTNWLGGMALICGALALVFARREARWGRLCSIGILAYALASPWIPPTDIAAVQRNSQLVGDFPMGGGRYFFLALWLAAAYGVAAVMKKYSAPYASRFAAVFCFLMAIPPLGYDHYKVYFLPQPDRYHLEMDIAIAILAGILLGSKRLASRHMWSAGFVALALVGLTAVQAPRWRHAVRDLLPGFDITKTVERAEALFMASHYPGQRVNMVGSTRFWFNAFADNPQLGGGFDQGRSNPAIASVTFAIPYVKGNGHDTVALLKAYGVRAIGVGGPNSRDAYRDYADPGKFAGVVPEVWRDGDDAIYEIPGTGSLAHLVKKDDLVSTSPVDWPAVNRYATALDAADERTKIRWDSPNRAAIAVQIKKPEVVSVQMNWDPGWQASVNGKAFATGKDALGLLVLDPPCQGSCTIDLEFTGGLQRKIVDILSFFSLGICAYLTLRSIRPRPAIS